ncbi:MAG: GHKL domain-containing protein [Bacteroidia bacterium]|nr:GHKL domain-containing protein [Bacteroidia bacterium]
MKDQILDILQLYEYSMSIGKSLNYNENCNSFLKLILKRNDLNAGWIVEKNGDNFSTTYSIPNRKLVEKSADADVINRITSVSSFNVYHDTEVFQSLAPIILKGGSLVVFNVSDEHFLFLYSVKASITDKKMNQLLPIVKKFMITLRACTAFKKQENLLSELEIRNQELNDYAHVVSHDLKSPLRNVNTLATWLKEEIDDKSNETVNEYMALLDKNILKMEGLISGVLTYSTVGMNEFESSEVDLNCLIDEIIKFIFIPENIRIIKNDVFPTIKGDSYRLQQLFQNLISNAIKYNNKEKGIVEIGFSDQGSHYEFYVRDNGIGIEKKYHDKIFTTFQTLGHTEDSSGIGLSIAKKIVTKYGGEMWVESEVDVETTFHFTIEK